MTAFRQSPHSEEVPPDASAMIESMRAYGYTLPAAVADLVDNSIAAQAKNIWVTFTWNGADSWATVIDDGAGMSEAELRQAMRLGSKNPTHDRDKRDLGRFGLGLKTASLSQCRRLTVASKTTNGTHSRRWDLDHLSRSDVTGWQLLCSCELGSETRAALPGHLKTGTIVLWECMDRIVSNATKDDRSIHRHFQKLLEDVEKHLSMVFHRFLAGRSGLKIWVNGNLVAPWDPFLEGHMATQPSPPERIPLPGHADPVRVRGFVLPHKDLLGEEGHSEAAGPAGWNAHQGFYVYRNDRLIVAGSWLGLGGARPWTKEEHYKLARIQLDIPNSMDHMWHLDVKKSSADPPAQVRDRLQGLAQKVRSDARSVFAHRGKYRNRSRTGEYRRPWTTKTVAGARRYRIDRKHPVVDGLLEAMPKDLKAEAEAMLRIIEETVPVEQIWLDTADEPDRTRRPFHGSTARQVASVIQTAYAAIRRNRKVGHDEALELLLTSEEFSDEESQAVIAALREDNR